MIKRELNFDKLGHFLKGTSLPVADIDMKKASNIRDKHPKYKDMPVRDMMKEPIWDNTNTNGVLIKQ